MSLTYYHNALPFLVATAAESEGQGTVSSNATTLQEAQAEVLRTYDHRNHEIYSMSTIPLSDGRYLLAVYDERAAVGQVDPVLLMFRPSMATTIVPDLPSQPKTCIRYNHEDRTYKGFCIDIIPSGDESKEVFRREALLVKGTGDIAVDPTWTYSESIEHPFVNYDKEPDASITLTFDINKQDLLAALLRPDGLEDNDPTPSLTLLASHPAACLYVVYSASKAASGKGAGYLGVDGTWVDEAGRVKIMTADELAASRGDQARLSPSLGRDAKWIRLFRAFKLNQYCHSGLVPF